MGKVQRQSNSVVAAKLIKFLGYLDKNLKVNTAKPDLKISEQCLLRKRMQQNCSKTTQKTEDHHCKNILCDFCGVFKKKEHISWHRAQEDSVTNSK